MTETDKTAPDEAHAKGPAATSSEDSGDVIFETLWGRVVESWDDEKTHAALIDYALRAERLPDAAGRYRSMKDDPVKGERAAKKLGAIVLAAESMLMEMKTPRATKVPWQMTASVMAVSTVVLLWIAYALARR
jgi:hypothetical protein